jgi:hypothetical protein
VSAESTSWVLSEHSGCRRRSIDRSLSAASGVRAPPTHRPGLSLPAQRYEQGTLQQRPRRRAARRRAVKKAAEKLVRSRAFKSFEQGGFLRSRTSTASAPGDISGCPARLERQHCDPQSSEPMMSQKISSAARI